MIEGSNMILLLGPFFVIASLIALGVAIKWSKTEKKGGRTDRSLLRDSSLEIFFRYPNFFISAVYWVL